MIYAKNARRIYALHVLSYSHLLGWALQKLVPSVVINGVLDVDSFLV